MFHVKQLKLYIRGKSKKTNDMKAKFYSAVVKINSGVGPVVGIMLRTEEEKVDIERAKCHYKFLIQRYFGKKEIFAFGEIDETTYREKTNINIISEL